MLLVKDRRSGQDGGIDRHTLPPRTTTELHLGLKTNNTQNHRKIE